MAMEQIGYVAKVDERFVQIRVKRESACGGNCHSCSGCPDGALMVTYPNDPEHPFEVGEQVRLMMSSYVFVKDSALTYGLLAVGLVGGAILGYTILKKEIFSLLGAILGVGVSVLLVRWYEKTKKPHVTVVRHI